MFGQGCPPCRRRPHGRSRSTIWSVGARAPLALLLCAIALLARTSAADPLDVRVRIAWGGGEARSWQGTIRVSEGTLSDVTPLGLEPDAPGSMLLADATTIRVFGRTPRSYDGCDVRVQAPPSATLLIQLGSESSPSGAPIEVPLARVARDFLHFDLDDRKNRLLAQRSPGDTLRVSFKYPSLIFSTGEKFELEIQPQQLELPNSTTYLLAATLGPARTDENVWSEEREIRTDEAGQAKGLALAVPLPESEGVYDLRLALYPKRLTTSIVRGKALATRKVQLVVVAPVKTIAPPSTQWQSMLEFDPASPKWWERMARLPNWARLPTVPRPVESGPAGTRMHLGRAWLELPRRAWQAYPLSVSAPGAPHAVEIEFPSDIEQTLGISIIEPNAAGYVGPIGVDSGIDVSQPEAGHTPGAKKHRLLFWPQTRTPYLLLVNRREDRPAIFGKVDVQAGPLTLAPLPIPAANFATRMLAGYYDKPLFAENFSAPEALDPISHRGFDDWVTFAAGGQRLVETLQHSGYSGLVLTAACEGSAIYPSRLLEPTPKYDSGVFFESGQDAMRKDILELLFRLCDRNGLVLIPGVQFAGPLPALEAIRQANAPDATGLEPIGPDGRTPASRAGGQMASGVFYNALDDRVQQAMISVVAELAERYGHHASFGGVAVQLNADSYALLPDETCSLDDVTFGKFLSDAKLDPPPGGESPLAARWQFIRHTAAQPWLEWRAQQMTNLFQQMRDEITRRRSSTKLYLTTANLLSSRQLQTVLRPELPPQNTVADILPLLGIDLNRLRDSGIVIPRPRRIVSAIAPDIRGQEQHYNRQESLDKLFATAAHGAVQNFMVPAPLRLPDFDAVSPFGADKTRTILISQIAPAEASYRERFVESLARLDSTLMIDGGWLLPLGQEAALAPLAKVYRRLPAEPFVAAPNSDNASDLIVRTLTKGDKTYFYAVNPSPWPLTAKIQFAGPRSLRLTPYCDERQAGVQPAENDLVWTVAMEPFDLVGGELSNESVKVVSWTATPPSGGAATLAEQTRDLARRTFYLREHPRAVAVANDSFEERNPDGTIPGWIHAAAPQMVVEVDRTLGNDSRNSLHLANRGAGAPVWVRSNSLPTPTTGRIRMTARIRVVDPTRQPQLRLAVEGKLDGQVYYRRVNVGAKERDSDPAPPVLTAEWQTHSISLTDLPTSGLTGLCVGFDLMSDGEVWIDNVQAQDLWLQEDEYNELFKIAPTANLQAQSGRLNECRLLVEGYWPSFLRRHVQLPDTRETAPAAAGAGIEIPMPPIAARPKRGTGVENESGKKANWLERTAERNKSWWPNWMKWK